MMWEGAGGKKVIDTKTELVSVIGPQTSLGSQTEVCYDKDVDVPARAEVLDDESMKV